jgi:hypothetical protein
VRVLHLVLSLYLDQYKGQKPSPLSSFKNNSTVCERRLAKSSVNPIPNPNPNPDPNHVHMSLEEV